MTFMDYIKTYFTEEEIIKRELGLETEDFLKLQKIGLIPKCSYHVKSKNKVVSYPFGEKNIDNGICGKYYPNSIKSWYERNKKNIDLLTENKLKEEFCLQYIKEMKSQKQLNKLFPQFFNTKRDLIPSQLREQAENTWIHHINGTYGICVKSSCSISAIVEKQIAVAMLTLITNDGKKRSFNAKEKKEFLEAAEIFDKIAMPFSSIDYEYSSRKKLLDNIKKLFRN